MQPKNIHCCFLVVSLSIHHEMMRCTCLTLASFQAEQAGPDCAWHASHTWNRQAAAGISSVCKRNAVTAVSSCFVTRLIIPTGFWSSLRLWFIKPGFALCRGLRVEQLDLLLCFSCPKSTLNIKRTFTFWPLFDLIDSFLSLLHCLFLSLCCIVFRAATE